MAGRDAKHVSGVSPSQSDQVSTVAISFDSASSYSDPDLRGPRYIQWESLRLGAQIQQCHHHAQCPEDVKLLDKFLQLARLPDIDRKSVKLLFKSLAFLRRCDYSCADICSILAHASAYFVDVYDLCGGDMSKDEVGNVLVALMFVAHCYVQDETCPLKLWHRDLFYRYCPLSKLNEAVVRLLGLRRYILRLEAADLAERYSSLTKAVETRRSR